MAIVKNKAVMGSIVDPSFCTPNRYNAGSPAGALLPAYGGEIVMDTTNDVRWKAHGDTINDWSSMDPQVTPAV